MLHSIIELTGLIVGILFLLLIALNIRAGWIVGVFGTLLMMYIYYYKNLYFIILLQIYYFIIGIYGYIFWGTEKSQIVTRIKHKTTVAIFCINCILVVSLYIILNHYIEVAFITIFATMFLILDSMLQAIKYLSAWYYSLIANMCMLIINLSHELWYFSILSCIYIILSLVGYIKWSKIAYNK